MFRRTIGFFSEGNFLQRANILELSIGLVIVFALQRVISSLINSIIAPLVGALIGGLSFSNYFVALTGNISTTELEEAQKQGAVLAFGEFFTTLINFLLLLFVCVVMLRVFNQFKGVKATD